MRRRVDCASLKFLEYALRAKWGGRCSPRCANREVQRMILIVLPNHASNRLRTEFPTPEYNPIFEFTKKSAVVDAQVPDLRQSEVCGLTSDLVYRIRQLREHWNFRQQRPDQFGGLASVNVGQDSDDDLIVRIQKRLQ